MLTQIDIERISRYINAKDESDDIAWIEDLFSSGHKNHSLNHYLKSDWENHLSEHEVAKVNLDRILDRVHHFIREKESQKRKTYIYKIFNFYTKAAAVLLLPIIIAGSLYFGYLSGFSTSILDSKVSSSLYAPLGSRVSFNLPDGTKGWLNGGSKLTYSLPFSKKRKVTLNGEAWFDVYHDEKRPFEVNAGKSKIKVLGTSFDVNSYDGEKYIEVVLQSGKVEFLDETQAKKVILKPSEQLIFKEGRINIHSVDVSKYKAWTEGKLIFREDDMAEVVRRIERWYNVDIEIDNNELSQFSFRATFENESLEDVLLQLSKTSPIGYKIFPRKQLADGTLEKKKVILYKK